jgi:3-hydroxyisobutyrate dehydrogenase-like beta-hydroxyacid dehydrogenase
VTEGAAVGFIGLGAMGAPMAARLLDVGNTLVVCDTRAAALAPLLARGAQAAATPAEVAAHCATVFACLPTPAVVEEVALGPDGLAAGARGGALATFLDLSTTGPDVARRVAAGLSEVGVTALDLPVTGGVPGAAEGSLTLIGSGPSAAFARVAPLIARFGTLHHVGEEAGQAQLLKLINNLLSSVALVASAEALALGVKAGLDIEAMLGVINAGSGRNSATLEKFPRSILPRRFSGGLALGLAYKDVSLCMAQAELLGVPLHMGSAVKEAMFLAKTVLGSEVDATNLVRLVEGWAGVELAARRPDGA